MIPVWDLFVRVFHWSLVVCIGVAWFTSDDVQTLHTVVGYIAGGLVAGRVIWGFVGSKYARFSQFVRSPEIVIQYLKSIASHREQRYLGHNPAGGAMIIALILAVSVTCITGWMMTTDAFWGVSWVQKLHDFAAKGILLMVLIHVIGVVVASVRHRENLPLAMLSGRKRRSGPMDIS